ASETPDGVERAVVTRRNGRFEIVRREPLVGIVRESHPADGAALIGRPSTGVFELLVDRLRDLAPGASRVVEIFGPGVAPNYAMERTRLRCWRTDSGGAPRYSFRATRRNATYAGLIECDDAGALSALQLIAAPTELGNQLNEEPPTLEGAG